jgi:hypothetical protein
MRLTILLLIAMSVAFPKSAIITDVNGVWVADITRCNFGTASHPLRLALNVTKTEDRLNVIEISNSEHGANLAQRQYTLRRGLSPISSAVGRAKITGRTAVLQLPERLDQWRISEDGSELIVTCWIGRSSMAHQQVLIFKRSTEIPI